MKIQCLVRLAESFRASRNLEAPLDIPWETCPAGMNGDLTVNCFRLAKALKSAPDALAEETVRLLVADPDVAGGAEHRRLLARLDLCGAGA